MKEGVRKSLTAFGWLVLFVFLAMGMVGSLPGRYGSPVGAVFGLAFFGGLELVWLRLAWKTMKTWFDTSVAIGAITVLLLIYAGIIYIGWVGVQS